MSRGYKIASITISILLVLAIVIVSICGFAVLGLNILTDNLFDDYSALSRSPQYQQALLIDGITPIKQDISCGYAVIEMISKFLGGNITEESLYKTYGKVVTSTGKSFEKEMNKQFKYYHTTMYKYLSSSELIKKVYASLQSGLPVPFEWAAKYKGEWTLHYSIIIGLDIVGNKVTVINPYGYQELITIKQLLDRTSYRAYTNMPLFTKLGFAFGIFEKNAIFIMKQK